MQRSYKVKATTYEGNTLTHIYSGGFSYGAFDAAKAFCNDILPKFKAIPGGRSYPDCFRFDAIDYDAQMGAAIWVTPCSN